LYASEKSQVTFSRHDAYFPCILKPHEVIVFLGTNTAMKNKDTILNEARIAGAALGQYAANNGQS